MGLQLDQELVSLAKEGRLVLFLGAGASSGAKSPDGKTIPKGSELAASIAKKFLNASYEQADLKTVYDLACSNRSVREVQRFLHETFKDFEPTPSHLLIPKFPWAGLATTNYDLLVERSFEREKRHLDVYARDGGIDLTAHKAEDPLYLKLHGCVLDYEHVDAPLVTSTEQLINYKKGRANLFKQFLEWGQNHSIAFVGYSMSDPNLRALVDLLVQEGDNRPRHFIIRPDIDDIQRKYWQERRFGTAAADFAGFITALDDSIPSHMRALGKLAAASRTSSFTKFITRRAAVETPHLLNAFETTFEHITTETNIPTGSAKQFYSGVNQDWFPVANGLDVVRTVNKRALAAWIIPPEVRRKSALYLIKGHAGAGKSISLRRLAWDAARVYQRMVLFLKPGAGIDEEALEEITQLTDRTVYLFVDDAADRYDDLRHLMSRAAVKGWSLIVIGAERESEWNVQDLEPDSFVDDQISFRPLSEGEIEQLVKLLEQHDSLGELASLKFEQRVATFRDMAGRQLLVALHEATKGTSFEDIIENEYDNLMPAEAKVLYLDICTLHQFGPPVRAGLISRVHGIGFNEFRQKFFKPLENVVVLDRSGPGGDFAYKSRHNYIAEVVFKRGLKTKEERHEAIIRILEKLNPDYSYDKTVLLHLIRAKALAEMFPERALGISIYQSAERSIGRSPLVLHQQALYEMRLATDRSGLDRAEALIREALAEDGSSGVIRHTLAELALRRSVLARSSEEASVERRSAAAIARQLAKDSPRSYAHHTLAKIAIADLAAALSDDAQESTELSAQAVNHAIQEAESVIRTGLNRFPNDEYLLTAEAELSSLLKNANRALRALVTAFERKAGSELVANRLAAIYLSRGEGEKALSVLKKALDANPGRPLLNLRYAKVMAQVNPGVEADDPDTILFYMNRANSKVSDSPAQLYNYGRQLFLAGRIDESREMFGRLVKMRAHGLNKPGTGRVLSADRSSKRYSGQVAFLEDDFGLIDNSLPKSRIYFRRLGPLFAKDALMVGDRVTYFLEFNSHGPIACDMQKAI